MAAATMVVPAAAQSRRTQMEAYPAMQMDGQQFAIRAGKNGTIEQCDPLDPGAAKSAVETACAKLVARGIPAEVTPARSTNDPATWVTYKDYPADALRRGQSGAVLVMMVVGTDGKIAECRIQGSTGNEEINEAVCDKLKMRARFKPATYKGQPVLAVRTATFNMYIP